MFRLIMTGMLAAGFVHAAPPQLTGSVLTYSNRPLGSPSEPLVMRTFMPEPGLGSEVLARHYRGARSPKYSPKLGKDIAGEYKPIAGLPAAIGVNFGGKLSYCWDTTECRLLYAWQDGFLDMKPYWGDPKRGNRQSYGYVPKLVGTLFYKASGGHPLMIDRKSLSQMSEAPQFMGYRKKGNQIVFLTKSGDAEILTEVSKGKLQHSLEVRYRNAGKGKLSYQGDVPGHRVKQISDTEIVVTIQGSKLAEYQGTTEKNLLKGGVNIASGKRVFGAMACATCHSLDGSKSHGPSLLGLYGSQRKVKGLDEVVIADDAYILESIQHPNKKIVEGYPENYMPPYKLKPDEYKALLLYIKSIRKK